MNVTKAFTVRASKSLRLIQFHYFRQDLLFIYNVDTLSIVISLRWVTRLSRLPTILNTRLLIRIVTAGISFQKNLAGYKHDFSIWNG